MTSQEQLEFSVQDTAESGHEFMLDMDDDNFRDVIEIRRNTDDSMVLVVTTGGPHITLGLPSGVVHGTWGNSYATADMPKDMARTLYDYFNF